VGRQIDEEYIQNGKVRFGYWQLVFLGEGSKVSAEASECAGDQGVFWEYHDMIFDQVSGSFNQDTALALANQLGLDLDVFETCMETEKYGSLVLADTESAQLLGVKSTPSFLINGQFLVGAQPYEAFDQIIRAELEGQN
jgi:protein-disulfide isomerase